MNGFVKFRLLGALELGSEGMAARLGGPRQRAVLAALLLRANGTASIGYLTRAAWADPPVAPELWDRLRPRGDSAERALPCQVRRVPQEDTLRALHGSREWRTHAHLLVSAEPADAWREGCWRFSAYDGDTIQVVFAIRLEGRPPQVNAAVIAADTNAVLSGAVATMSH